MAKRDNILEGLAWAGISEDARVARISALLVRELSKHHQEHTKTRVKEAVRNTSPPYGRGKAICKAVEKEYRRQAPIYQERFAEQAAWNAQQEHLAKRSTRINRAYAGAFARPPHKPSQSFSGTWDQHEERLAWVQQEQDRDKGDDCIALTHQDGYVVALVLSQNSQDGPHIATRLKSGPIVRTYIRTKGWDWREAPEDLVEAAVLLGGPKVRCAIAKGKRVKTDWIERCSFIYHDGSDHHRPKVERVPWSISILKETETRWGTETRPHPAILDHGQIIMVEDED